MTEPRNDAPPSQRLKPGRRRRLLGVGGGALAVAVLTLTGCGTQNVSPGASAAESLPAPSPGARLHSGGMTVGPEIDNSTSDPWLDYLTGVNPGSALTFTSSEYGWRLGGLDGDPHLDLSLAAGPGGATTYAWPGESILATSDGGRTWTRLLDGTAEDTNGLWGFDLLSASIGWAVGVTSLHGTTDGGHTWRPLGEPAGTHLVTVDFTSPTTGWGLTTDGSLVSSTDGGATWSATTLREPASAICFAGDTGYAVSQYGDVYATRDHGHGWQVVRSGAGDDSTPAWGDVACTGDQASVAVQYLLGQGHHGKGETYTVASTSDRGQSWRTDASTAAAGTSQALDAVGTVALAHGRANPLLLGFTAEAWGVQTAQASNGSVQPRGRFAPPRHDPQALDPHQYLVVSGASSVGEDSWVLVQDLAAGTQDAPQSQTLLAHSGDGGATWQTVHSDPATAPAAQN